MAERRKRFTAAERERGLMVCVRIEFRRPGGTAVSVGSGECSLAWHLLPSRAAFELFLAAVRTALHRLGARPVYSPSGTDDGPWMHLPRRELCGRPRAEGSAHQGALFEEG